MPSERPLPRIGIAADPVRSRGSLPRNRVPPSWFCTTSAASSAREVAGLLHPAASHGVRRVSCHRVPGRPATWTSQAPSRRSTEAFPRDAFHTPRRIPPDRSRTTSLWPLPPCRSSRVLLASPDRHRCQHRPLEIRLTGTPATRLSSAVGSVTLIRPLPASERPILPGLRSPSRSFSRLESSVLSRSLPCIRREIRKWHDAAGAPFRTHETCASRATPASSLRRATSGGGRTADVRRRSLSPPGTRHRRDPEGPHRPGSIDTAEAA